MTSPRTPRLGLVEDSADDFAAFERIVAQEAPGLELRHWPSAEELLADLAAGDPTAPWPTALVIDLNLPGLDGADLVERLRAGSATRALPAFVLSGSNRQRDIDRCYAAGANAYLTKPGGIAELRALLRMLLASLAAFQMPTSVGGTGGLEPADLTPSVDQEALEEERRRYEEELAAERARRKRAEVVQRLTARLAGATSAGQVETLLLAAMRATPAFASVQLEAPTDPRAQQDALFMPDPFGSGTTALLPLSANGRIQSVLTVKVDGPLAPDDEALLHAATSVAAQALARIEGQQGEGAATDLPTAQWWRDAAAAALRDCRTAGVPLTIVAVDFDAATMSNTAGHVAADERLLQLIDAWRSRGHELLSPGGTESRAVLLPGLSTRRAQQLVGAVHRDLPDTAHLACAVAQWDGAESADALLARARAAVAPLT